MSFVDQILSPSTLVYAISAAKCGSPFCGSVQTLMTLEPGQTTAMPLAMTYQLRKTWWPAGAVCHEWLAVNQSGAVSSANTNFQERHLTVWDDGPFGDQTDS